MKIEKIESGIHTFEFYANHLKYHQVQAVVDHLYDMKHIYCEKSKKDNMTRTHFSEHLVGEGIRLRLHQTNDKSNGIGLTINPSTLLSGKFRPTKLFKSNSKKCSEIIDHLTQHMVAIDMARASPDGLVYVKKPEELSICQLDLTMNIWFDHDIDLSEVIRLIRKGNLPKDYKRRSIYKEETPYYYAFGLKDKAAFKVYDKIHELDSKGLCPDKLADKKILRIEVSLKREKYLLLLGLDKKDDFTTILKVGTNNARTVLLEYLHDIFPCTAPHLRFRDAKKQISDSDLDEKLKEQLLFLLRKTSDGDGLDTAISKFRERYGINQKRQLKRFWKAFDKLNINPISLPNDSKTKSLPNLLSLLEET